MWIDPQTFVALLCVAAAVAILARRVTVWLRSGGETGCGSCGSCAANSPPPVKGLVSLTDFTLTDFHGAEFPASVGSKDRRPDDKAASTPA